MKVGFIDKHVDSTTDICRLSPLYAKTENWGKQADQYLLVDFPWTQWRSTNIRRAAKTPDIESLSKKSSPGMYRSPNKSKFFESRSWKRRSPKRRDGKLHKGNSTPSSSSSPFSRSPERLICHRDTKRRLSSPDVIPLVNERYQDSLDYQKHNVVDTSSESDTEFCNEHCHVEEQIASANAISHVLRFESYADCSMPIVL